LYKRAVLTSIAETCVAVAVLAYELQMRDNTEAKQELLKVNRG